MGGWTQQQSQDFSVPSSFHRRGGVATDYDDDDGECFEEGQGVARELFHVILICDGSSPVET